jgi:hypothetical protein
MLFVPVSLFVGSDTWAQRSIHPTRIYIPASVVDNLIYVNNFASCSSLVSSFVLVFLDLIGADRLVIVKHRAGRLACTPPRRITFHAKGRNGLFKQLNRYGRHHQLVTQDTKTASNSYNTSFHVGNTFWIGITLPFLYAHSHRHTSEYLGVLCCAH